MDTTEVTTVTTTSDGITKDIYEKHVEELTNTINALNVEIAQLKVDLTNAKLKINSQDAVIKAQTSIENTTPIIEDYIDEADLSEELMKL